MHPLNDRGPDPTSPRPDGRGSALEDSRPGLNGRGSGPDGWRLGFSAPLASFRAPLVDWGTPPRGPGFRAMRNERGRGVPADRTGEGGMPLAKKMDEFIEHSSWIRRMFEEGTRLKALHGADKVFDFSLGNPNLEPPEEFDRVMQELLADPRPGLHGYMANAGYEFTREAVAAFVSEEQAVKVPSSNVVMTGGAGGALNVVFKAILEPGDEVLVPKPYFVEYGFYVDNHGGVLKPVDSTPEFDLDLDAIEAAITPRTRAVLINSPNNPSGRVYPAEAVRALGGLLEHKWLETGRIIYLVSDEPYRHIVYDGLSVPPVMSAYTNTIVTTSYSKDLSLSGERIGFLAVHPDIPEVGRLMAGLVMANRILGFVNAPALMQRAVARLQGVKVDVGFYQRNRDVLWHELQEAGFTVPRPDGAFYLFPKAPTDDDVAFVRELQERLVLVVPGSGFGGPGHFRISYCVSHATVDGALPILRDVGRRHFG
ncbi:MAG: pyridoxal phosphate-dependent aminotransferase [Thermoleophilia bacterium]